ncbi:hypothetical protein PUN28_010083 [Cardiocondyla obscurior]|uniref:Uncharacterized protein n=1 Tax=Cardiocondyla obscurior TaxID=286306 RepID=A0AAW2FS55_9HYME
MSVRHYRRGVQWCSLTINWAIPWKIYNLHRHTSRIFVRNRISFNPYQDFHLLADTSKVKIKNCFST